jgi:hypothetical protein
MSTFVKAAGNLWHQVDETQKNKMNKANMPVHVTMCGIPIVKAMPTSPSKPSGNCCKGCEKGVPDAIKAKLSAALKR